MEIKNIEAYHYYKQKYPETVIFFRVNHNYEVYQEDAIQVGSILGEQTAKTNISEDIPGIKVRFHVDKGYDYIEKLSSKNIPTKIVSHRNENGNFDVPDIQQLEESMEIDY